jgi:hypothetical protein
MSPAIDPYLHASMRLERSDRAAGALLAGENTAA